MLDQRLIGYAEKEAAAIAASQGKTLYREPPKPSKHQLQRHAAADLSRRLQQQADILRERAARDRMEKYFSEESMQAREAERQAILAERATKQEPLFQQWLSDAPAEIKEFYKRPDIDDLSNDHPDFKALVATYPACFLIRQDGMGWEHAPHVLEWMREMDQLNKNVEIKAAEIQAEVEAAIAAAQTQESTVKPATPAGADLADFVAYLPTHGYIFKPTREMWPASSVNSQIAPILVPGRDKPLAASAWLDINAPVQQMTWAPGHPMEIRGKLIADGGWIERPGSTTFNLFRPSTIKPRQGDVTTWLDHVRYVFGEDADHIIKWLAHRVQRPHEKVNHALVLGGLQGIGKDTLLEPVKVAVGPWNFLEVSPQQVLGRFNGFVKSVILRVSEARDMGDADRYALYEHLKTLCAAPPDVLRVDEKHLREHAVLNVCGVIITTNRKDALALPADDRRHFVAWSTRSKEDFRADYWTALYRWFARGGSEFVAHYLATLNLSGFDAKAPPPKTQAFWEIVDASRAPEDAEMADTLDQLGRPNAVTLAMLTARATGGSGFHEWLRDRKNRRLIPHRLNGCGYIPVRNPGAEDGLWKVIGKRQAVYTKRDLCLPDQIAAAQRLIALPLPPPG